ncbi:MAG: glycoside hydrolase family 5 protein [Ruminococcaceae bacterium]|nr:glycoside hydrolase family 5 protein [Oscillospiraceae bacterium]
MEKIKTSELRFVDEQGRTRLFNGMNIDDKHVNCKEFHYNLDESFFRKYKANGFDIIRLAITWQNLEPNPEEYNESYLKSIDEIFRLAEKYGVYILLDMHQDLYSQNDGKSVGDGAPSWAAITDGAKPRMPIFVWADGYFLGKWVRKEFDNFWNNTEVFGKGLQDRYCDLWQMLAKRYGNSPALFGFDLMNEPFPGSYSNKMFLRLVSGVAKTVAFNKRVNRGKLIASALKRDTRNMLDCIGGDVIRDAVQGIDAVEEKFDIEKYSPFLNKTTAAIREVTPNGIVMMEQSYICNSGVKQSAPPITVNGVREENQCFGPHAYDFSVDTPLYQYANASRVKAFFGEMRNTQLRLGVPVIVGEWGGCSNNKDTSWFPHAFELLDFFDEMHWGQMYWDYHGDDLDSPLMNMLCRTHPVAVAGEIERFGFNRISNIFRLSFNADKAGESIIYVHKPFEMLDDYKWRVIEKYESGASLIGIKTDKGKNEIKIQIKN